MTECNGQRLLFSSLGRQQVQADFAGGTLTSDAGALLLREVDRRCGLLDALAACLNDPRDPARITHDLRTMLAQRIYGLALGYEDLNDHATLRQDPLFAILADQRPDPDRPLASAPTLYRLENRVNRASLGRMAEAAHCNFTAVGRLARSQQESRGTQVVVSACFTSLEGPTPFSKKSLCCRARQN